MAEKEGISFDMVDPLTSEKPFFINESSKFYQKLNEKDKKFPTISIVVNAIFIPILALLMGVFYIGGTWDPVSKLTSLDYLIVNEDAGCSNNNPICMTLGLNENTNFGSNYKLLDGLAGKFAYVENRDLEYAKSQIEDQEYWLAFHIPRTFTTDVLRNLNVVSNTTLTPVMVDAVFDEARNYITITYAKEALKIAESSLFSTLASTFDAYGSFNPLFLIEGIQYVDVNLHPVSGYGQNVSTFISLILLWIGTIGISIISHFFYPFEKHWIEKEDAKHAVIKTIALKCLICGVIMFINSLIVAIIPLCCGDVTLDKGFGALLFFLFFYSLTGLGINNLLIHLVPFVQYYLVVVAFMFLQLASCGGIIDNKIQYGFWNIGKAFPMYYGVREMKYIYWSTGSQYQTANVLILLAWAAVTLCGAIYLYFLELKVKRRRWLKENQISASK